MAQRKPASKKHTKQTKGPSDSEDREETPAFKPKHFINRELSWLAFNKRVLEEAQDPTTPLLERIKFLSIFSSNLDEFFMVRVAGLREQAFEAGAPQDRSPDGCRAIDQLRQISTKTRELIEAQYDCLLKDVLPKLEKKNVKLHNLDEVRKNAAVDHYFKQTVFPILTPMAIDPSHPRPRYHNRSLYVIALLRRRKGLGPRNMFAVVQIPHVLPRLIPVTPSVVKNKNEQEKTKTRITGFLLLEDLITSRLPELFGGFDVETSTTFRITRDSDVDLIQQESGDVLHMMEERLKARRRADAVRLEVAVDADPGLVDLIVQQEQIRIPHAPSDKESYTEVYHVPGPIDLTGLMQLRSIPHLDALRDAPVDPQTPRGLRRHGEDLLSAIRRRDILLHHPYDSFRPVVDFVRLASEDPDVLAIKQTVYRTSGDSPIVQSLIEAAENGKHVTAIVELQARFDEQANVAWARQLERSGAHVVYGFMDLKTHCKISMISRQEDEGVRRYVHLSTGNYNPTTAEVYTDVSLFTADPDIAEDASALFNMLTGYSQGHDWKKLIVAPTDLQRTVVELIDEQALRSERGKPAGIFAKLNSLVDPRVIEALYRASQANVKVELVVRGVCCLRPGIQGVSENIRVWSIVDRFLEHSRIYVFGPDESAKIYLSSADWMPRNFYRRVEVMFPIESPPLCRRILQEIFPAYRADNVKSRELRSDGTYQRIKVKAGEKPYRSQQELMDLHIENTRQSRSSLLMRPGDWHPSSGRS